MNTRVQVRTDRTTMTIVFFRAQTPSCLVTPQPTPHIHNEGRKGCRPEDRCPAKASVHEGLSGSIHARFEHTEDTNYTHDALNSF